MESKRPEFDTQDAVNDKFLVPRRPPLEAMQKVEQARLRRLAQVYFGISLFIFAVTILNAVLRFPGLSGGGFGALGGIIMLWDLTVLGIGISLFFSMLSILNFKAAIYLFIVELIPFAWLVFSCIGSGART